MIGALVPLALWLVASGCSETPERAPVHADPLERLPDRAPRPGPLRLAVTPIAGDDTQAAADLLGAYLEEALGAPVVTDTARSYATLADRVGRGIDDAEAVDLAFLSPLTFVEARTRVALVPLATASAQGSPTYLGLLMVRADRDDLHTLDDLRGSRVAWVHPLSTSGYLFPRALLRHRGHDPDAFFGTSAFVGDHLSALRAVAEGRADVAAVSSTYIVRPVTHDIDVGKLRVVAKTERLPLDCAVVRADLSKRRAAAIRDALLALDRHPEHSAKIGRVWGLEAFVPYIPDRYARIEHIRERDAQDPARVR